MARQLMGREYEVEFYVLLRQYGRELKVMKSNEYHLKVSICAYFAHLTSTGRSAAGPERRNKRSVILTFSPYSLIRPRQLTTHFVFALLR